MVSVHFQIFLSCLFHQIFDRSVNTFTYILTFFFFLFFSFFIFFLLLKARIGNHRLDVTAQSDHVIWLGDLNYRVDLTDSREGKAEDLDYEDHFERVSRMIGREEWSNLYGHDQLRRSIENGMFNFFNFFPLVFDLTIFFLSVAFLLPSSPFLFLPPPSSSFVFLVPPSTSFYLLLPSSSFFFLPPSLYSPTHTHQAKFYQTFKRRDHSIFHQRLK